MWHNNQLNLGAMKAITRGSKDNGMKKTCGLDNTQPLLAEDEGVHRRDPDGSLQLVVMIAAVVPEQRREVRFFASKLELHTLTAVIVAPLNQPIDLRGRRRSTRRFTRSWWCGDARTPTPRARSTPLCGTSIVGQAIHPTFATFTTHGDDQKVQKRQTQSNPTTAARTQT